MQHTSYKSSRFELQMADVNDNMCPGLAMADEDGFVMSYQEAHNLVAETYPGYLEVNESCRITDWQAAKHISIMRMEWVLTQQIMVLLNRS